MILALSASNHVTLKVSKEEVQRALKYFVETESVVSKVQSGAQKMTELSENASNSTER